MRLIALVAITTLSGLLACSANHKKAKPDRADPSSEKRRAKSREKAESPAPATPSYTDESGNRTFRAPVRSLNADASATRYANMSDAECNQELKLRKLRVRKPKKRSKGLRRAVRIFGALNRVAVRRPSSPNPHGLLDCRLFLALDDFTKVLDKYGIVRLHIGSMYREGARIAHSGEPSQHASGMAMDILALRHNDGLNVHVEHDWHADIGDAICGPDAVMNNPTRESTLLRNVVCEAAREHIFHVILTPSANRSHKDHLHFDITPSMDDLTLR